MTFDPSSPAATPTNHQHHKAALKEAIRIREKKRIETEALIAHLEELLAASEVADAQAKAAKELEKAWEKAISSRCKAERQAQGTLDAERRRTASQVAELHTEVARVRLFDDAAAADGASASATVLAGVHGELNVGGGDG